MGSLDTNGTVVVNDTYVLARVYDAQVAICAGRDCCTSVTPIDWSGFIDDDIDFAFGKAYGHALGNTWVLQIYECDNALPDEAFLTIETTFDGG